VSPPDFDTSQIPDPVLEAGWENDPTSARELQDWDNLDKLSRQKKENVLKFHRALGWCIPVAMALAFAGLAVSAIVYLIHVIGPGGWRWLSPDEVQHLHNMLFSGVVGAALAEWVRHYMKKAE
jgi:hypothetical protein